MESLNQRIKQLVQTGKEKGYLTYEELNDILPDDADISPEKIDDILIMLDELGIDLIDETEIESRDVVETEEVEPYQEVDLEFGEVPTITEKIDDPVRMYLTQMGEIPLLTRDEEIKLAKKIEITRKRFLKKVLNAMPSPTASISGNPYVQKTASGSRRNSRSRASMSSLSGRYVFIAEVPSGA